MVFLDFPNAKVLLLAMILLAIFGLSVLRFAIGSFRWKPNRLFFFLMDGLLATAVTLGCLVCTYQFFSSLRFEFSFGSFMFGLGSVVSFLVSIIGWRVCQALANAPELFESGKFPHKFLMQEVKYRQEHGIP